MIIRDEQEKDYSAIFAVNESAFETEAEARLVDVLRTQASPIVSLVAEETGNISGHIMFSPVSLSGHPEVQVMGLGPMAVLPYFQRKEIGSRLVRAGLKQCRNRGIEAIVVLGHPEFYPRFGFMPASRFGIDSAYDVPDEVFMALELQAEALTGKTGRIAYHSAFGSV